ncbi:MAG: transcriptional repressor [Myxococcota bacterium]
MANDRSKTATKAAGRLRRDLRSDARDLLRAHGLRVTTPRIELLLCLTARTQAMTHSEVVELMGEANVDAATIYRNLVKLAEHGVIDVVSRAGGMARYAAPTSQHASHEDHIHFLCVECGSVSCLPSDIKSQVEAHGKWRAAVMAAQIQLEGQCPDCRARS